MKAARDEPGRSRVPRCPIGSVLESQVEDGMRAIADGELKPSAAGPGLLEVRERDGLVRCQESCEIGPEPCQVALVLAFDIRQRLGLVMRGPDVRGLFLIGALFVGRVG